MLLIGILLISCRPIASIMFSLSGAAAHSEINLDIPKFSPVRWLEEIEMDYSIPEYLMLS